MTHKAFFLYLCQLCLYLLNLNIYFSIESPSAYYQNRVYNRSDKKELGLFSDMGGRVIHRWGRGPIFGAFRP